MSPICNGERAGVPSAFACFLKSKLTDLANVLEVDRELVVDEARDAAWTLFVDVYCVDDDGCVIDAMLLGLVAAVESTVLPQLVWNKTQFALDESGRGARLALKSKPVCFSFGFIDKWMVSDPNHEEEEVSNAIVSVGLLANGTVLCVEKRGGQPLSRSQLEECVKAAQARAV
jgi:exosome complex RNA-binding protein Rrp42 (RNase PH superfamily)